MSSSLFGTTSMTPLRPAGRAAAPAITATAGAGGAADPPADPRATSTSAAPEPSREPPPRRGQDDDENNGDDDDDEDKKGKKGKAKKAEDDDEGDKKDDDDEQTRAARARERGKFRAVLDSPAGQAAFAADPVRVMRFLVGFSGTRNQAIATLELFGGGLRPASTNKPLRDRSAEVPASPGPGDPSPERRGVVGAPVGSAEYDPNAVAAAVIAADKRRRGEAA